MLIKLASDWRFLPGVVYGLKQSSMLGSFSIQLPAGLSLSPLDAALNRLVDEPLFEPRDNSSTPHGLACRAIQWMIAVQHYCNIPASDIFHVGPPVAQEDDRTHFPVAIPTFSSQASSAALHWIVATVNRFCAANSESPDHSEWLVDEFGKLQATLKIHTLQGLNTFHFMRAADQLDIPVGRIAPGLFSVGTGCHSRWLESSITDQTSRIGVSLAQNKMSTATVLRKAGLPAPSHIAVASEEQALAAARRLGYPVVVKPIDQEQGRGVAADLNNDESVRTAVAEALTFSANLLVEKHFSGTDYRLTVLHDQVIKVESRVAGGVNGDGKSSVAELVKAEQALPRFQKILRNSGKMLIALDREALELLAEQGLSPESIPAHGDFIVLRRKNNISTGGKQMLIPLDAVHPDNLALAVRAAQLLHLDMAGIDLLITDIAISWYTGNAIICEVNSKPQIGINTTPDIYRDILASLLGGRYRIPVNLVLTGTENPMPAADIERLMARHGCNGLATLDAVHINGHRIAARPQSGFHAAQILLAETRVHSALCILPVSEILKSGLPADRFASVSFYGINENSPKNQSTMQQLKASIRPHLEGFVAP